MDEGRHHRHGDHTCGCRQPAWDPTVKESRSSDCADRQRLNEHRDGEREITKHPQRAGEAGIELDRARVEGVGGRKAAELDRNRYDASGNCDLGRHRKFRLSRTKARIEDESEDHQRCENPELDVNEGIQVWDPVVKDIDGDLLTG